MKSLNVLKYNQKLMAAIGIYSHHLTGPGNEFFKSMVTYYCLFVVLGLFIMSSGSFAFKNMEQFMDALEAMSMVIVGIQCGGMHLSIGLNMKAVKALHLKLQGIVDEIISGINRFSRFIRKCYFWKEKLFFSFICRRQRWIVRYLSRNRAKVSQTNKNDYLLLMQSGICICYSFSIFHLLRLCWKLRHISLDIIIWSWLTFQYPINLGMVFDVVLSN